MPKVKDKPFHYVDNKEFLEEMIEYRINYQNYLDKDLEEDLLYPIRLQSVL